MKVEFLFLLLLRPVGLCKDWKNCKPLCHQTKTMLHWRCCYFKQRALKVTMDIPTTGRYHIVFRYLLNESLPVMGEVMFTPKGRAGSKQSSKVTFPVTSDGPAHQTVGEEDRATQFMLTKGKWDLMLLLPPANVLLVRLWICFYSFLYVFWLNLI